MVFQAENFNDGLTFETARLLFDVQSRPFLHLRALEQLSHSPSFRNEIKQNRTFKRMQKITVVHFLNHEIPQHTCRCSTDWGHCFYYWCLWLNDNGTIQVIRLLDEVTEVVNALWKWEASSKVVDFTFSMPEQATGKKIAYVVKASSTVKLTCHRKCKQRNKIPTTMTEKVSERHQCTRTHFTFIIKYG